MSVDLEWDKLDSALSFRLVELLNNHLSSIERPSFIGPVEVASLDLGTACPDIEIVDMRDIYRDFLEDEDEEGENVKANSVQSGGVDDDEFEWVSRRTAGRALAEDAPAYHHFPPHLRYGRGQSSELFGSPPGLHSPRDIWKRGTSLTNLADFRPPYQRAGLGSSLYGATTQMPTTPASPPYVGQSDASPLQTPPRSTSGTPPSSMPPESPASVNHPNLQLHLRILHNSDLRLTITTSLLINYPSPMFMSLPIKLSVTGLVFNGEVVVAYEGERRRVHFCILDDLDPYGPAGDRPKRDSASATPPDDADEPTRPIKPLPLGQRLLPSILIESEIGQADKHVLKNVTRVERFIQDVIRKTVEDELVFPNFHTLILG